MEANSQSPAVMMDLFTTVLTAAGIELPGDRVIDGRDMIREGTGLECVWH